MRSVVDKRRVSRAAHGHVVLARCATHRVCQSGPPVFTGLGLFDAVFGPGFCTKACSTDSLVRRQANSIGLILDSGEGFVYFSDTVFFIGDQAQRELVFPIVASQIRHVNRHAGVVRAGFGVSGH